MAEKKTLMAEQRQVVGKQVKTLRAEGKLPGVIYGHNVEPTPITLDERDASNLLRKTSLSTLLTVYLDGEEYAVLVRETQKGILDRRLLHVDFQAIDMDEIVRAHVEINLSSDESPAVQEFGALLVSGLDALEIECLPNELPENIEIDVSGLEKKIGDTILVRDLDLPEGITILDDPDTMLVVATPPSEILVEEEEEEEEELLEVELGMEEPEVIEKGKVEDEEEEPEEEPEE